MTEQTYSYGDTDYLASHDAATDKSISPQGSCCLDSAWLCVNNQLPGILGCYGIADVTLVFVSHSRQ